jgi:hypothetical protein
MLTTQATKAILLSWNLSERAIAILSREPEIVIDLQHSRSLPPLPPGYVPQQVEVLLDDMVALRYANGEKIYERQFSEDFEPQWIEWRFDNQSAVFAIGGEYVLNRTEGIAEVVARLGLLSEVLCF